MEDVDSKQSARGGELYSLTEERGTFHQYTFHSGGKKTLLLLLLHCEDPLTRVFDGLTWQLWQPRMDRPPNESVGSKVGGD